jgi:hypothetical protein
MIMKCHNKSELMPVCFYLARFLGARWAFCDCMSVDYFISYIWDSKWLPRMPQERDTAFQLGNLPSSGSPVEQRGQDLSSQVKSQSSYTHQGHEETLRTQNKIEIKNKQ